MTGLLGAHLPVALAHTLWHERVGAAFYFRDWWAMLRANKLGYLIAWVIVAGLIALLYLVSMLIYYSVGMCCFMPLLTAPIGF